MVPVVRFGMKELEEDGRSGIVTLYVVAANGAKDYCGLLQPVLSKPIGAATQN